jgi:superfamily II RNA helicase
MSCARLSAISEESLALLESHIAQLETSLNIIEAEMRTQKKLWSEESESLKAERQSLLEEKRRLERESSALKAERDQLLEDLERSKELEQLLAASEKSLESLEKGIDEVEQAAKVALATRDLIAASGMGLAAGAIAWSASDNGWIVAGSAAGVWLASYGALRIFF